MIKAAIEEVFAYLPPEKILITMDRSHPAYEGMTIAQIAAMRRKSPADCYVDMVCAAKVPVGVIMDQDMDIVRALMSHDYIITASDGWTIPKGITNPHPRV